MHVTRLTLRHFRNIATADYEPSPGLNLIWGDNGQGKTNLLEGMYMALVGRSFRTHRDETCLPWKRSQEEAQQGADPTRAQVELNRLAGGRRLRVMMGPSWKRVFADGQWLSRLADLWGEAAVVAFTPEAAGLFKSPPAGRRQFINMVLSQLSRPYLEHLQRYGQAHRQLNAALKSTSSRREIHAAAQAYYPILAEAGAAIMIARATRLAGEALPSMAERCTALGATGHVELSYDPNLKGLSETGQAAEMDPPAMRDAYLKRLEASFDESLRLKTSPIGIHRDDFSVRLDGRDLRRYGSQGQHRLVALALHLESARWIQETTGEPPILLLDDFGSELDPSRRQAVLEGLRGSMQVFITATDRADLGPAVMFDQLSSIQSGVLSPA